MPETKRCHAIPMTRREVVDALVAEVDAPDREPLAQLCEILAAIFHFEFHAQLEELKEAYHPINPDHASEHPEPLSRERGAELGDRIGRALAEVLARGNYRKIGDEEREQVRAMRSLFPINVTIDFEVFAEVVMYARGESLQPAVAKRWFGLRKENIEVPTYDRLCLYLRFKPEQDIDDARLRKLEHEPGRAVLKLFRNIPKADLEMVFPNTRLRMRTIDKLLIGVPAVVGGVPVLAKLAPAILALAILVGFERGEVNLASIIAGLGGLVGLGAFLFRQWDKFRSRKLVVLKMLNENLYFKNIDNNEGVLTRLIDEAEEEEHKEAILAYFFLRQSPGLTLVELDARIEQWLKARFASEVDFEVDDALSKLERLGLAERRGEGYEVIDLPEALATLDTRWDAFFPFNTRSPDRS